MELLYQGKLASLVTSSGSCGNISKNMAGAGYELGVACYPTYNLNNNSTEIGGGNLAMISKGNTEEQIKDAIENRELRKQQKAEKERKREGHLRRGSKVLRF